MTVPDCLFDRTGRESQRFDESRVRSRSVRSRPSWASSGCVSNSLYPGTHLGRSAPPFSLGLIACGPMNDGAMDSRLSAGRKWRGRDESK